MAVSAQRRRRMLVAVVAALIAAGAFVLALSYSGKGAPGSSGTVTPPRPTPSTTVVVAGTGITKGARLTTANLTLQAVPSAELSALTAVGGSDYTSVALLTQPTSYATRDIAAGVPILSSMVTTDANAVPSSTVPGTTFDLPNGYVAMSLPYNTGSSQGEVDGDGTGGYLLPGDRIDILAEVDPQPNPSNLLGTMSWAYQDVLVLAVGGPSAAPSPSPGASPSSAPEPSGSGGLIMVALPQQDAATLTYMKDAKNVFLQYLLVAAGDYPKGGLPAPSPIGSPQAVNGGDFSSFLGG